ncbi:hypothetical protein AMTRI_Chr03g142170 [Amborella trichopoda]
MKQASSCHGNTAKPLRAKEILQSLSSIICKMSIYIMYRGPIVPVIDSLKVGNFESFNESPRFSFCKEDDNEKTRLTQSKHCVRNNIGIHLHYDVTRRSFHTT